MDNENLGKVIGERLKKSLEKTENIIEMIGFLEAAKFSLIIAKLKAKNDKTI